MRNRRVFDFCRRLKAIPELGSLRPSELLSIARAWHERALPHIGTKDFGETWQDFLVGWGRVRWAFGTNWAEVLALAEALPEEDLHDDIRALGKEAALLARICTVMAGEDGGFFLACRAAGELIGVDYNKAAGLLRALVALRFLKKVRRHTTRKATRYRLGKKGAKE